MRSFTSQKSGFTIVELIIVIAVIAVLAIITVFGFGAWQKSVRAASVKTNLNTASAAIESARNFTSTYPTSLPTSFVSNSDVTITPTLMTTTAYCLDGVSTQDATILYYIYSKTKDSGPQEGTCASRPDMTAPATPTGVVIGSVTGTSASVSWPTVAEAVTYTAQCASDTAFIYSPQQNTVAQASGTVSTTVSGLTPASAFYCRVRSVNTKGVSAWSAIMSSETSSVAAPGSLAVSMGPSGTSINYSFNSVSGASSYNIQRSTESDFSANVVTTNLTGTSGTASGLAAGTTYYFRAQTIMPPVASSYSASAVVSRTTCPNGFIAVPGSTTYGTSSFCVMKYEAKQDSGTTPISQASGTPWVNITQTAAIAYSPNVAGCTGCHLITEAEYLTIAQNVLNVNSNWSGGVVGSGFIYTGHNDASPNNTLAASTDDSDGYYGTGNSAGSKERRTLTLSNGEVIWDLAGNVHDWTSGTTTNQPGASGYAFREWNAIGGTGGMSPSPFPVFANSSASAWTSANGIGQVYSSTAIATVQSVHRGGAYSDGGSSGGIFSLTLNYTASNTDAGSGFRVAR